MDYDHGILGRNISTVDTTFMHHHWKSWYSFVYTAAIIAMERLEYTVEENVMDGIVIVCAQISALEGDQTLGQTVFVTLNTLDGTAGIRLTVYYV